MGLFGNKKKSDIYERNTRIAELETKIEALTAKVDKLKIENANLKAQIANLQNSNEALSQENGALGYNLKKAREEAGVTDEGDGDEDYHRYLAKIEKDRQTAIDLKQTAMEKYALEIKRLKLFADKWQAYFDDSSRMEKQELINLLTDLMREENTVDGVFDAKAKVDKIFEKVGEPFDPVELIKEQFDSEETGFNIDDAINPKGELNLEDLCKELGVFEG